MGEGDVASNGRDEQIEELKRELDGMKVGQAWLISMLADLKPTTEAIRNTQIEIAKVSKDTNTEAHLAKHGVLAFPANMKGFTNLTEVHYDRITTALDEFRSAIQDIRIRSEYSDAIVKEQAHYTKELKDIVTIAQFREIVAEIQLVKQTRSNRKYLWWIILALGALAGVIKGIWSLFKLK